PSRFHLAETWKTVEVPKWRQRLHKFFQDHQPTRWLAEDFDEVYGGGDIDDFMKGMITAKNRPWKLSAHFASLNTYYTTDPAGTAIINIIRQRGLTELKRQNAEIKKVGDIYDGIASPPTAASLPTATSGPSTFKRKRSAQSVESSSQPRGLSPCVRVLERINQNRKDRKKSSGKGTVQSFSSSPQVLVDPEEYVPVVYSVGGQNVGQAFYKLQLYGIELTNNPDIKATIANLKCFLAVNYIWDMVEDLGLPVHTKQLIRFTLTQPSFSFSDQINILLCNLETELSAGKIQQEAPVGDELSEDIIDICRA
ncbi:hypothetical protein BGZ65_010394, partial [Modicella reniformis]